jgi:antirestriction protein ArdC
MARSRTSKFDASEAITNELIRIIERGVLPWRKPWTAGGSARPLRHNSEPYQGVNNFLLTMRTVMAGYTSPFWMTVPQANTLGAKIRKGERSSVVVYYGQSRTQSDDEQDTNDGNTEEARVFRFQKSYRVFNADQIEGLPEAFRPDACPVPDHVPSAPIPHMQAFFDAIDITTVFGGTEARYNPPVDKVFMPSIERFKDPLNFYGVWAHELAHNAALRFMPRRPLQPVALRLDRRSISA